MKSYKIIFLDEKGNEDETYFGDPVSNFISIDELSESKTKQLVLQTFYFKYPYCKVISIDVVDFNFNKYK